MTAYEILSKDQMAAVLENAPVAVFVSAVEDYKLLYVNRMAQELFPGAAGTGVACYTVAGFSEPCSFCLAGDMSGTELRVREFHHPKNHRIYQLSGKLIDWAGQQAHIEYILDVTDKKLEQQRYRKAEEELLAIFDSISCGLCVYRVDGDKIVPVFHNRAFYHISGYSEEHIQSVEQTTSYLGVHPEDMDLLREKVAALLRQGGVLRHSFRLWSDREREYRWIQLEGTSRTDQDGRTLLYGVYSDVSEQRRLDRELSRANEKMEDIVNAIPGGVAIYKVSDLLETVYFSDGVPTLTGYTIGEYHELTQRDAAELIYPEDKAMVINALREALQNDTAVDLEFRKQHRDGHIVWVHAQAKQIGEEGGFPLVQCVFHNISALKEAQRELDHLVNSIPGGIASYRVEGGRFLPTFYSDGVVALSGHTREEYEELIRQDVMDVIYQSDRKRVLAAAQSALKSGEVLDISYRMYHKNGSLIWVHFNGRRMEPLSESTRFYAIFTGMIAESGLLPHLINETADGIYIIDKENYELLYVNETKELFGQRTPCVGQTCYAARHGLSAPCAFCGLSTHGPDEQEHQFLVDGTNRFYTTRIKETNWNGIPAYVHFLRDVTDEVCARKEKERLEMYFQTLIKNLPGGISVVRCLPDGSMTPEFFSEGFAAMTRMTLEAVEALHREDVFSVILPEDRPEIQRELQAFIESGKEHCELEARMMRGDGSLVWVRGRLSMLEAQDGIRRIYCIYTDISQMVEEKNQLRRQHEELVIQHFRTPGPDTLLLGHCNITRNVILEVWDSTHSDLLTRFGRDRDVFFTGLSSFIVDEEERRLFISRFLNASAMEAFARNETEQVLTCFFKLPQEALGRYVRVTVNMVEAPDSGDVTGILSVKDITDQTLAEQNLHQLSVTSHDFVVDLNLVQDTYTLLSCNEHACRLPAPLGCYSERVAYMAGSVIVPRDRETYAKALAADQVERRLTEGGPYTLTYSLVDESGAIRTKNMTVSAIELRLGRVSLVCTDITSSVREQQGLLSMLAYTFERAGMINVKDQSLILYTREMVLDNLPPFVSANYSETKDAFTGFYATAESREEAYRQFSLETMLQRLAETPAGYEFVLPHLGRDGLRYKQINVLWGDRNQGTICLVRMDVTEMLATERQAKATLENALTLAEEASQAKSEFLSAMSHDIRTPLNAIMGMTTLAAAHLDDRDRVADYLRNISISSKHLLSLVNDVLDMSRIESAKLSLNRVRISLAELLEHLSVMIGPQAEAAGLQFAIRTEEVTHPAFYGDPLRINQVLINLLSNAVKFTPAGGRVDFTVTELPSPPNLVRYRFTLCDTGIGMTEAFLERAFDPFARDYGAMRMEGTGLGLSIAHGLVELMQGEISVESKLNEGTVFQVELDFEPAQGEGEQALADASGDPADVGADNLFAGRCFLVAEDNGINAEILSELLKVKRARAVVKRDGAQAVQAFRESAPGTFDCILMDIQMPHLNGYEATRTIRALERPDAQTVPIIALTANAFAEDIQASANVGMNAHVAKPVDLDILRETLRKVMIGPCRNQND